MISIVAERLAVEYPIYDANARTFRRLLLNRGTGGAIVAGRPHGRHIAVRAIDDVSFSLYEGDRLALIGRNGAGKTTLLRTLAGVYEPTAGRVVANGRLSPVFDINPGLDLDDTCYENVVINGLMLGLNPEQIRKKMPDIVAFTELGDYMHMPVRALSAGMHVRLAFAISTAVDPEIILLDESIGSFDAHFADKAEERLERFIGRSAILILASHSDDAIRRICNKGLLLSQGRIVAYGNLDEVLERYRRGEGRAGEDLDSLGQAQESE